MKYTINNKEYTEFDIKNRCAELMNIPISFSRLPERIFKLSVNSGNFTDEYNPCNNWNDAGHIIEKCWYELNRICWRDGYWWSHWDYLCKKHNCTELVAACICLIEIKEQGE